MIRFLILFVVIAGLVGAAYTGYGGLIEIEWFEYKIKTSAAFCLALLMSLLVLLDLAQQGLALLTNLPVSIKGKLQNKRYESGLMCLNQAFISIFSGEPNNAFKFAKEANKCVGAVGAVKLIKAHAYRLSGDVEKSKKFFNDILNSQEMKLAAMRGLIMLDIKADKIVESANLIESVTSISNNLEWCINIKTQLYLESQQWSKVIELLEDVNKRGITSPSVSRNLGLVYCILAKHALQYQDKIKALSFMKKSYKFLSNELGIVLMYAEILYINDKKTKAFSLLRDLYGYAPHFSIAKKYVDFSLGFKNALPRVEELLCVQPNHPISHFAVAKCAVKLNNYTYAEMHAQKAKDKMPSPDTFLLLAEIKLFIGKDSDDARSLLKQALELPYSASWHCVACGTYHKFWFPICSGCKAIDKVSWFGE